MTEPSFTSKRFDRAFVLSSNAWTRCRVAPATQTILSPRRLQKREQCTILRRLSTTFSVLAGDLLCPREKQWCPSREQREITATTSLVTEVPALIAHAFARLRSHTCRCCPSCAEGD